MSSGNVFQNWKTKLALGGLIIDEMISEVLYSKISNGSPVNRRCLNDSLLHKKA